MLSSFHNLFPHAHFSLCCWKINLFSNTFHTEILLSLSTVYLLWFQFLLLLFLSSMDIFPKSYAWPFQMIACSHSDALITLHPSLISPLFHHKELNWSGFLMHTFFYKLEPTNALKRPWKCNLSPPTQSKNIIHCAWQISINNICCSQHTLTKA